MPARQPKPEMQLLAWMLRETCCLWCILSSKTTAFASSRLEAQRAARDRYMKIEHLKKRMDRDRPMTSVTLRMPGDVVDDLKRIAPLLGFSGYQPLMRAYIGQGLRKDLERLDNDTVEALVTNLKRRGVSKKILEAALSEVLHG